MYFQQCNVCKNHIITSNVYNSDHTYAVYFNNFCSKREQGDYWEKICTPTRFWCSRTVCLKIIEIRDQNGWKSTWDFKIFEKKTKISLSHQKMSPNGLLSSENGPPTDFHQNQAILDLSFSENRPPLSSLGEAQRILFLEFEFLVFFITHKTMSDLWKKY